MDIFGIPARDFAAYWGAGLASLLAAVKLLHPRPTIALRGIKSVINEPEFHIRIKNNAAHPIVLEKVHVFGANATIQTGSIAGIKIEDVVFHALRHRLDTTIDVDATLEFTFVCEDRPKWLVLVLTWQSHRMLNWPLFPSLIFRTFGAVRAMLDHPIPDQLK